MGLGCRVQRLWLPSMVLVGKEAGTDGNSSLEADREPAACHSRVNEASVCSAAASVCKQCWVLCSRDLGAGTVLAGLKPT